MLLESIRYRIRQFLWGLYVSISPDEQTLIAEILSPDAQSLFEKMPLDAQRHSLNVFYTLREQSKFVEPDLAVAALLHDMGKVAAEDVGIKISLWLRGPLVLLNAFFPEQMKKVALEGMAPRNLLARWRYVLYVYIEHPTIGAKWAKESGCSPLTCWLIAHHQTEIEKLEIVNKSWKQLLFVLQQADGRN